MQQKSLISTVSISGLLILAIVVTLATTFGSQKTAQAEEIVVYKSPTCGCCKQWVTHLRSAGLAVEVHERRNMNPIKREMGVPGALRSCHTAKIGGYVIEGHVPAEDIARLLQEKPNIKGLAVPGMPMGSPGMEGPRVDAYEVLAFDAEGKTSVFSSHN